MSVSESLVTHSVGLPGRFDVLVTLSNTGAVRGAHSVLVFLTRPYQSHLTPDAQTLIAFEKLELMPGETRRPRALEPEP